jgi:hypothetical protein
MMEHGAIAVITDTAPFKKALRRHVPMDVLEPRDYYATEAVPVSSVLTGDELRRFLRGQWNKLPKAD